MSQLLEFSVLTDLGGSGCLFALLLAGHALGDFVFQSATMVQRKNETKWLFIHGAEVTCCQALMLAPVLGEPTVWLGLLVIFGTHTAIDRFKTSTEGGSMGPVTHFLIDQLLHLLVLTGVWWALVQTTSVTVVLQEWGDLTVPAVLVSVAAFNVHGTAALISACGGELRSEQRRKSGRLIGILERQLMLGLALLGQWLAFALVVVGRSVSGEAGREAEERDASVVATLIGAVAVLGSVLAVKILS